MKKFYNKYLKWLNPYYWISVFVTWASNHEYKNYLASALLEADKEKKQSGKKMLVFAGKDGIRLISKQDLKRKKLGHLENKAFYKTK